MTVFSLQNHRWQAGFVEVFLVALLSISAVNCFKNPITPVAPSWDVNLTFPVGSKSVSIADMIGKDSTVLRADANNRLFYSTVVTPSAIFLGDKLSISPSSSSTQIQLGSFAVDVKPLSIGVNPTGLPPGATTLIPPMRIVCPDVHTTLPSPGSVTLSSGMLTLSLRNNLPVSILSLDTLLLVDDNGNVEGKFDLASQGVILPTQTVSASCDMTGRTIGNGVNIQHLSFSTPGSRGLAALPTDSMLVVRVSFSNLRASQAQVNALPAQRLTDNDQTTITLDDSTRIQEVDIRSGRLQFNFTNRIDLGVMFRFRLEDLLRLQGASRKPYEDSVYLPSLGRGAYQLDLAGCQLRAGSGDPMSSLRLTSSVIIPQAISQPITVHDTDKIQIAVNTLSPIVIDSVVGVIKPTWVTINSAVAVTKSTLLTKLKGQFTIPAAKLSLNIASMINCPIDLFVTLSGKRADGTTVSLDVPAGQRRIQQGNGTVTFDDAIVGQFLSRFSGGLPDSIRISGSVLVNPPDSYSAQPASLTTIGRNSSITGSVNLSIPLTVGIAQATYRDTTAFAAGDNGSNKKPAQDQLKRVNGARLHVEVQNGLPAGVSVRLRLLDKTRQPVLTLPQSGQTFQIAGGNVDGQGLAVSPGVSSFVVDLSHDDAQQYLPAEYVDYEVSLSTNGGSPVTFRTTDSVNVRVWTECSYGVNR